MDCIPIYKCLAEEIRLRILHLLLEGPLCVCHVQAALQEPQAKISKQLAFLKRHGILRSSRKLNWTIYEISPQRHPVLEANLEALAQGAFTQAPFNADLDRLTRLDTTIACGASL